MTPHEMAESCAKALNNALPGFDANVMLVWPKGVKAPPKFPRGKLACVNMKGERVKYHKGKCILDVGSDSSYRSHGPGAVS